MSWIAPRVSDGRRPPGGAAAANSARQVREVPLVHPPTMAASVRNVARVSVAVPFGVLATAEPTVPAPGRTRLGTVAAAFGSPGDGPARSLPRRNRASE